ncbi:helix-turn-helix transcriptional regulator [Microcoleus sp. FACHB-1515]|uniref:helix-turn-helix domain-containing protein n=1 Tax=Cyanophyceae TaxID=3028117 RepID=UPI001682900A|nr:AraC family transcriptional regulator [Microcoleus sp. FACHB-1515]MBD2092837.1 helix-turn-helix transcriptional regulator [Microcoleus sp. FACHB-1515]
MCKTLAPQILSLHAALGQSIEPIEQQSRLIEVFSAILLHYADVEIRSIQSNQEHNAVRLVKEYLHDNFSSNVSLDQLAEITRLDRSYLTRIFRQAVGMPPYTYLNQIRVEKAKQFLQQGMAVAEVAIAVGMSDQSHLTRHFKRIFGITPGHYRTMSISSKTNLP